MAVLSVVCFALNDSKRAVMLYDLLRPYAARNATLGWGEASYGSIAYYLGLLACVFSNIDEVKSRFEAALRLRSQDES